MTKRPYISPSLRQKVTQIARYRCGYCLTPRSFTAMPMQIDHIIPIAAGGPSTEDNLWLACALCNGYKGDQISALDPETQTRTTLFDPRRPVWRDHFRWSADGVEIIGQTACGRATVIALKLNNSHFLMARPQWVEVGWHPPDD